MKIGDSVRLSITDWQRGEPESAMMHACNAVDGTASKLFPRHGSKERFISFLRENYWILGPTGAQGVNLEETRFPVKISRRNGNDEKPDIAEVIYCIHRCAHGHGDELLEGFSLMADADKQFNTTMIIERGKVHLSDRVIFGLLFAAVLSPVNKDQQIPDYFFLSLGATKLPIHEWWGRAADFPAIVALYPSPSVKLDFGQWDL